MSPVFKMGRNQGHRDLIPRNAPPFHPENLGEATIEKPCVDESGILKQFGHLGEEMLLFWGPCKKKTAPAGGRKCR